MKAFSKKWIAVAAGLALSSVSALASHVPALAFNAEPFNVNPLALNTVPGATAPETTPAFVAGSITFDYRGLVNQAAGGGSPATSTFDEKGSIQFGAFYTGVGGTPLGALDTGLNLTKSSPVGYSLYGQFTGTGTSKATTTGGVDGLFSTFDVQLFVDRDNNTTFAAPKSFLPTTPGGVTTDDVLVLTGSLLVGGFHVFGGLANGDFDVQFNVTGFGPTSFFSTTVDGQRLTQGDLNGVNSFVSSNVALPPAAFTNAEIDGSGNVTFQSIPEPTSLALVGIALIGGALARRKAQA